MIHSVQGSESSDFTSEDLEDVQGDDEGDVSGFSGKDEEAKSEEFSIG